MGDLQRCLQTPLQVLGHVCKCRYRSKKKISQFARFFTYLHCLHLKLNPTYPHYFHSKFKTHLPPPIPTPVLIPTLSQLASSDFFSHFFLLLLLLVFFFLMSTPPSFFFSLSFFSFFHSSLLHTWIYSFLFLSILILFPLFYLWWC